MHTKSLNNVLTSCVKSIILKKISHISIYNAPNLSELLKILKNLKQLIINNNNDNNNKKISEVKACVNNANAVAHCSLTAAISVCQAASPITTRFYQMNAHKYDFSPQEKHSFSVTQVWL